MLPITEIIAYQMNLDPYSMCLWDKQGSFGQPLEFYQEISIARQSSLVPPSKTLVFYTLNGETNKEEHRFKWMKEHAIVDEGSQNKVRTQSEYWVRAEKSERSMVVCSFDGVMWLLSERGADLKLMRWNGWVKVER